MALQASVPGNLQEKWVEHGFNSLEPIGPKVGRITDLDDVPILKHLRLAINNAQLLSEIEFWARTRRNCTEKLANHYDGDYSSAPNQASLFELRQANANRGHAVSQSHPTSQWSTQTQTVMPDIGQTLQPMANSFHDFAANPLPTFMPIGPTPIQPIPISTPSHRSLGIAQSSLSSNEYRNNSSLPFGQTYSGPIQPLNNNGYNYQANQFGVQTNNAYYQAGQNSLPSIANYANGQVAPQSNYYSPHGIQSSYSQPPPPASTPPPPPPMMDIR